jgi:hypothetical protein
MLREEKSGNPGQTRESDKLEKEKFFFAVDARTAFLSLYNVITKWPEFYLYLMRMRDKVFSFQTLRFDTGSKQTNIGVIVWAGSGPGSSPGGPEFWAKPAGMTQSPSPILLHKNPGSKKPKSTVESLIPTRDPNLQARPGPHQNNWN